jgi:hypothetical protein
MVERSTISDSGSSSCGRGRMEAGSMVVTSRRYAGAATEADDPDLRAQILSDVATQHLYLGDPNACLTVIRLADGDERISAGVRFVLHGVKARAYGASATREPATNR